MLPAVFIDIGTIKKVSKARLTDAKGIIVYSPKANKEYGIGGLLNFNKKVSDKVKITISFGRIIEVI